MDDVVAGLGSVLVQATTHVLGLQINEQRVVDTTRDPEAAALIRMGLLVPVNEETRALLPPPAPPGGGGCGCNKGS